MKRYLLKIWAYWKAVGMVIGLVMTPVHMFLVYLLVFGPANLGARLFRKDPLDRKIHEEPTFWRRKVAPEATLEDLRHTF